MVKIGNTSEGPGDPNARARKSLEPAARCRPAVTRRESHREVARGAGRTGRAVPYVSSGYAAYGVRLATGGTRTRQAAPAAADRRRCRGAASESHVRRRRHEGRTAVCTLD